MGLGFLLVLMGLWCALWGGTGAWLGLRHVPLGQDSAPVVRRWAVGGCALGNMLVSLVPLLLAIYLLISRPPGPPDRDLNPGFAMMVLGLAVLGLLGLLASPVLAQVAGVGADLGYRWGGEVGAVAGAGLGSCLGLPLGVLLLVARRPGPVKAGHGVNRAGRVGRSALCVLCEIYHKD